MNLQSRSDRRSLELHICIAHKLKDDPDLWYKPMQNIERWHKKLGHECESLLEWEEIFGHWSHERILQLITSESEDAQRLRSSSPFTGILTEEERAKVFLKYQVDSPSRHSEAVGAERNPHEQNLRLAKPRRKRHVLRVNLLGAARKRATCR